MSQVLEVAKRKWVADIEHHRQADDLGAGFEVAKGAAFCHPARLGERLVGLNELSSDSALGTVGRCHKCPHAKLWGSAMTTVNFDRNTLAVT